MSCLYQCFLLEVDYEQYLIFLRDRVGERVEITSREKTRREGLLVVYTRGEVGYILVFSGHFC